MADGATAVEQVRQSAVETVSPKRAANEVARQRVGEKYKAEGARATLAELRAGKRIERGATADRIDQAAARNIEVTAAAGTPERAAQEAKRVGVESELTHHSDYIQRGLEAFAATPLVEADFRAQAEISITTMPGVSELYANLPDDAAREQFVGELLNSAEIRSKANELYQQRIAVDVNAKVDARVTTEVTPAAVGRRVAELQAQATAAGKTPAEIAAIDNTIGEASLRNDIRAQEEANWQASLENVVSDATMTFMLEQVDTADKVLSADGALLDKEEAKKNQKEGEQTGGQVYERFMRRWNAGGKDGNTNVNKDFENFAQGGIEQVMVQAGIPAEQRQRILDDPALKAKYEGQIVNTLLTRRLLTGRLNRQDMIRMIGRVDEKQLDAIIDRNPLIKNKLQSLEDSGVVRRGFGAELRRLPQNKLAQVLLILLGAAVLPGVIGVGTALVAAGAGAGAIAGFENR